MTKLEKMIEIWEDKFLTYIDEYEDIEYIINPESSYHPSINYVWISDYKVFFKICDEKFGEGYKKVIIRSLRYDDKIITNKFGFFIHFFFE